MIGVAGQSKARLSRRRDLLQRLFELIKMRVVLRCPNLARLRHAAPYDECLLPRVKGRTNEPEYLDRLCRQGGIDGIGR